MLPTKLIAHAVIHVADRRGLASYQAIRTLVTRLVEDRIGSISELRLWLGGLQPGAPDLAAALRALMPTTNMMIVGGSMPLFDLGGRVPGRTWLAIRPVRRNQTHEAMLQVVKLLAPEQLARPSQRDGFLRNAQLLAGIEQRNVVRILDAGFESGANAYQILEFIDGGSLADFLRTHGRLAPITAYDTIRQLAEGMVGVHAAGVVHRDLQPANIMRERRGRMVVTNFTNAIISKEPSFDFDQPEEPIGDPAYSAPEQCAGHSNLEASADIYALGAIWYHLVTGQAPIQGENPRAQRKASAEGKVVPVLKLLPTLPEEHASLITRCLARDPRQRLPNAEALLAALNNVDIDPFDEAGGAEVSEMDKTSSWAGLRPSLRTEPTAARFDGGHGNDQSGFKRRVL